MRFFRTLISLGFLLLGASVLLLGVGAYLTATGRSVPVMRKVVSKVGEFTAGQATRQMAVSVSVEPAARHIEGVARLVVKVEEGRRRLFLFLNDGLTIHEVWRTAASGERVVLPHYRLWMMVAIDLGDPTGPDEELALGIAYGGNPLEGLSPFGQGVIDADEVILTATDFWYPTDLKSFFRADVELTLPKSLAVVHPGTAEVAVDLGSSRRVRWAAARPTTAVSLIAGRYSQRSIVVAGVEHRAFLAPDIDLDADKILESMAAAFASIGAGSAESGASRQVLFVSRRLQRSFADGGGIIGIPPAEFAKGDYGFAAIADGVARTWWGGTVSADPASPQAGGGWAVEGFAANAARRAVRERFGEDAEFRWRAGKAFDPTAAGLLAEASWVDDELAPDRAEALRNKAAYVAMMLQARIGDSVYEEASRELVERFRGTALSSRDVQQAFSESSGADLEAFFDPWVNTIGQVDLSLDPKQGSANVANHQTIAVGPEVLLWRVPPGGQPLDQMVEVGKPTPLGNAERLVVDPRGMLADMYRSNNVLPREEAPRLISRSTRGEWMVVDGEPHDWAPARILAIDGEGKTLHVWNFDLGVLEDPSWSADGTHILAAERPSGGTPTLYALHPSDGSMVEIGQDTVVHGGSDRYVAARDSRLLSVSGKNSREIARVDGGVAGDPRISPDGAYVAYTARRGPEMELLVTGLDTAVDRVLMTWPSGPVRWQWSPDSSRLFAVLSGDWDLQLWEIPVEGAPRPLMREAAGVRALAVSSDGNRIALAAQGELDYRFERYEVFLIDRSDPRDARHYTVSGSSVVDLTWRDDESLLVVVTDPTYAMVPARRDLRLMKLADGSVLPFP